MTISIALLVCDTPAPQVGPYYPIFKTYLSASLPNSSTSFTLDPYDVVNFQQYPPDDKVYDAVLITGSAASAYENLEWINKLVSYVAELPAKRPHAKIFGMPRLSAWSIASC
ncbi:hypothetical protein HGRIS_014140 [Hohenbuehelia grisea]|uniref:Class I glutamine amidotransferase-like protein n=1 Tax=Hohenbuehelia grisea TaxID=104357 RepID=A0ABR3JTA0_9AGAR